MDPDPCSWPLAHPPRNFLLLVGLEQVVVTAYHPRPRGSSCSDVQLGAPGCRGAEVVRDALNSHRGEDSGQIPAQPLCCNVGCPLPAVMLSVPWHCPALGCKASFSSPAEWLWEPYMLAAARMCVDSLIPLAEYQDSRDCRLPMRNHSETGSRAEPGLRGGWACVRILTRSTASQLPQVPSDP